jgi:hypothetical protein
MRRTLVQELLDTLPVEDERARRSRRDLLRINHVMGNARWWRRHVAPAIHPRVRVLELGPGDGSFRLLPRHRVDGLDRTPRPDHWATEARWWRQRAQDFTAWPEYHAVIGNLVFHHFTQYELRQLGTQFEPHVRVIAACEPRRARRYQVGFALLATLLAAGAVTRRDGHVSIFAGFCGDELPRALGLDRRRWSWRIEESWRGAYRMLAVRHR